MNKGDSVCLSMASSGGKIYPVMIGAIDLVGDDWILVAHDYPETSTDGIIVDNFKASNTEKFSNIIFEHEEDYIQK